MDTSGEKKLASPTHQRVAALSLTVLLIGACVSGDVTTVVHLISEKNANPFLRDESGRTPLGVACEAGHLEVVRHLIEKEGVSPGLRGAEGRTPLHDAARRGHVRVVQYLIAKGVNPDVRDDNGLTPLDCAKNNTVKDIIVQSLPVSSNTGTTLLMQPLSSQDSDTVTEGIIALKQACEAGSLHQVKYLIEEKHLNPHSYIDNENKGTPLHWASLNGNIDIVKYLVEEKGCDVECRDIYGETPLHWACEYGHIDIARYLVVDRKCDPISKDDKGRTALHVACSNKDKSNLDLVKLLVENGSSPLSRDRDGDTPLPEAARRGHLDIVKYFVEEKECDVETRDNQGYAIIHGAAMGGDLETMKYLCKRGCNPESKADNNRTPLHSACTNGNLDIVKYLIDEIKIDCQCREGEYTPLHEAIFGGHLAIVKQLVENYKCNPECRNTAGYTPLRLACWNNCIEIAKYLIEEVKVDCKYKEGEFTPLHVAANQGHLEIVKLIVENYSINHGCKSKDGSTPLSLACNSGRVDIVKYLIEEAKMDYQCEEGEYTALHKAAENGHLAIVKLLVENYDIDIGCKAKDGFTPLSLACKNCHVDIVKYLIEAKGDHQCREGEYTPLHVAAASGHRAVVKLLVEDYHCHPDVRDKKVKTPADYARERNHTHITSYLSSVMKRPKKEETTKKDSPANHTREETSSLSQAPPEKKQRLSTEIVSTEEAEQVVKKLLKEEGKFKQKNMVVVLTGLMGAGKTTLLHRIFGMPLPGRYNSTSIAERSWRGISHHTIDNKEFTLVQLMEQFELVAEMIQQGLSEASDDSSKPAEAVPSQDIQPDTNEERKSNLLTHEAGQAKVMPKSAGKIEQVVKPVKEVTTPISVKEMARLLRKNPKDYGELELMHLIDTGGQPECLEILPSLIHNADLTLLVIDASVPLDECIKPTFHKDGQKHEKQNLPQTNRQIIEQVAHTMAGRTNSKILVVATHTDCIKEGEKRQSAISELNTLIKEILPSQSLLTRKKSNAVFEVNLLDPVPEAVPGICENIKCRCKDMVPIEIPPSFVLFEREAMLYVEEKKERKMKVLNFNDCLEIGGKLDMSENVIEAALTYLHKNNIFLIFKEIESAIVFLEPKILIEFVNDIVCFSYSDEITPSLTLAQSEALSKGMITKDLLAHRVLTKNLVPGLFEAAHAIEIFKKMYIIAKSNQKTEYVMMCLLPRLTEDKKNALVPDTAVEPLVIQFEESVSPSGSFGNTIACLISKFKWKICTKHDNDEEPECLYHDIAKLHPNNNESLKITLVNNTKYFVVHAEVSLDENHKCKKLPCIKDDVYGAIREVIDTMQMQLKFSVGFECMCKSKRKRKIHMVLLPEGNSSDVSDVQCQHGELIHLDRRSLVWIKVISIESQTKDILRKVTMSELIVLSTAKGDIRILEESAVAYSDIGSILLRNEAKVQTIATRAMKDPEETVRGIYREWIQTDLDHTWKRLTRCFRAVSLNNLANDIEQHFGIIPPGKRTNDDSTEGPSKKRQRLHREGLHD